MLAQPDAPEGHDTDRFADTFYVLLESYNKKNGRTLDPEQVQSLVDAFTQIGDMNQKLVGELHLVREENEALTTKVAELETQIKEKKRLWRP